MSIGHQSIILYDGVCALCNWLVRFTVRRDRHGRFAFASLQSEVAREYLRRFQLPLNDLDSVVLIEDGRSFVRSAAILRILEGLDGLWKGLYVLIVVPRPLADIAYNFIARHRYRWFGRYEECILPTEEIKERILS